MVVAGVKEWGLVLPREAKQSKAKQRQKQRRSVAWSEGEHGSSVSCWELREHCLLNLFIIFSSSSSSSS
ncbi:hypothetical protein VNO80_02151 [Phaseolus coccineus]|uniref:Uncharacterized protein n=1 Tax=Phaseolus coccineus TaxID=3886 RepID=A0AAN9NPR0_PHACN